MDCSCLTQLLHSSEALLTRLRLKVKKSRTFKAFHC